MVKLRKTIAKLTAPAIQSAEAGDMDATASMNSGQ